jgi:lipoate-protein ligase A
MALDEALLEAMPRLATPVLRFYSWTEPAASFGYFQKYSDVERLTHLRPLIRRPTGGGIVPHDHDWTYSAVFPPQHPWYSISAIESYRQMHHWIQSAFAGMNISTELAPCCLKSAPGQCFAGHERFDLLWHQKKIAGAAQRRTKQGLLVQGSIQPPQGAAKADWQKAFCDLARAQWGIEWKPLDLEPSLEERVRKLTTQKYATREHNERRP